MIEIRLLRADDASAYWKIRLEALECDPEAFGSSAEEHRALSLEEVKTRLGSDPATSFVVGAFEGKELVGTAGFYREKGLKTQHKGGVWGVYVTAKARGTGVGRSMLRTLLEHARDIEGVELIKLSVATRQPATAALYRSLGFEPWGREPRALKIADRYIDEEHMVFYVDRSDARR